MAKKIVRKPDQQAADDQQSPEAAFNDLTGIPLLNRPSALLSPKERAELAEILGIYRSASPRDQRALMLAIRHIVANPDEKASPEELLARFRESAKGGE